MKSNSKKSNENIEKDLGGQEISEQETAQSQDDQPQEENEKAEESPEQARVRALEEELGAEKDKYLRLAAEYDNFRKRSQKERESVYADVRADTVVRFLPVYDNLERALLQQTEDEAYYKGIEMIMTQLTETMEKMGVFEIPALGKTFDPELHNAVMHEENADKGESEIVEVFQKGFKMGEKIIRFSLVKVAN